jgi:APA family basic amino acid/polyamine antiporter
VRTVPGAYKLVAVAVFAIYFTLPLVALSALPVENIDGELTTLLALPPEEGGYANDPILGVVENLGLEGLTLDIAEIYVGVLAATILFIATNAGVIGASRITYSMASYRQLPEVLRSLHPRFKTPWLSLVLFAGIIPILLLVPGDVVFIGTLYSLGATLSFTVAHAALIRIRMLDRDESEVVYRAYPNLRMRAVSWPLFAVAGGIATGASFLVLVVQNPTTRWVGLGWMIVGLIGYVVYRRRFVHASVREVVKAPPAFGPELALEYRRILVPVVPGKPSDEALDVACRLAAERGARIVAVSVIEMPLDRPLSDSARELESVANRELDEAVAIGDSYGVPVVGRLERARAAGPAIVAEAEARGAEIIVLGARRGALTARQRAVFGKTVDYVLKHAPCRTLVVASGASA